MCEINDYLVESENEEKSSSFGHLAFSCFFVPPFGMEQGRREHPPRSRSLPLDLSFMILWLK